MGGLQLVDDLLEGIGVERYLVKDAQGNLGGDALEILLAWGYNKASHIKCAWRYDVLLAALLVITVGAMLFAGEYYRIVVGIVAPAYDIKHGLGLAFL